MCEVYFMARTRVIRLFIAVSATVEPIRRGSGWVGNPRKLYNHVSVFSVMTLLSVKAVTPTQTSLTPGTLTSLVFLAEVKLWRTYQTWLPDLSRLCCHAQEEAFFRNTTILS